MTEARFDFNINLYYNNKNIFGIKINFEWYIYRY